jgi:phage tail tape-measure protein
VIGGVAGAVTGGTVGAVGDTIGEKTEDEVYGDAIRTANTADRNYDAVTQPEYLSAKMEADKNRLDEAGYVGGGMRTSAEADYADSSKVGTVGGGVAGAVTGAAMGSVGGPVGTVVGGIAGAVVGGGVGAAGDTVGERIEDTAQGDTTPMDRGYTSDRTMSSTDYRDDRTYNAGNPVANAANRTGDAIRDVTTDDQGTDTFQAADRAYDNSSKVGTGGGALAGAATGAAIGSVGGPVGAIVGGVAGAVTGAAAGAVGDTIGEEVDSETGAFSDANKNQYRNTADRVGDKAADAGNAIERGLDADLNRDGDVGRRG